MWSCLLNHVHMYIYNISRSALNSKNSTCTTTANQSFCRARLASLRTRLATDGGTGSLVAPKGYDYYHDKNYFMITHFIALASINHNNDDSFS